MNNQTHPATAQHNVDSAFNAAWKAARTSGGACFATDETGLHMYVQRHAPDEYAEYLRIPRGRMIEYSKTEQIQIELESLGIVETQECTA